MQPNSILKKGLAVGIILLFIGTAIIPASGQNIEKTSSASRGHWLYVGGSGPGNYSKIQDAIDNSSNGDTVFVYNGTYKENDSIPKSINLIGEMRDTTIIVGSIDVLTNYVNISGFTFQFEQEHQSGVINIQKYHYCNISNNIIVSKWSIGIFTDHYSGYDTFSNNIIMHCREAGIFCDGVHQIVRNNVLKENDVGIRIVGDSNYIEYNILKNNSYGIAVFQYILNNTISSNQIESNGYGISFNDVDYVFPINIFEILLSGGRKNHVSFNNFINNIQNGVFTEYLIKKIIWDQNYWDDYKGQGRYWIIGTKILFEINYGYFFNSVEIPWINFDRHPAQQPYNISGMR